MQRRAQHKSIRVFKSDFLERFTHVHPILPLVIWAPVVTYLLWRSFAVDHLGIFQIFALGGAGFLLWTLAEYLLHRFVFHFYAETPFEKRLQFMIHGLHHDDATDATRLVMPPAASIAFSFLFFGLFKVVFGAISHVTFMDPFFALFIAGYLCYDYIHFGVHFFKPRTRIGKFLKQSHMKHHFVSPGSRWGVSSPLWDFVFGTLHGP